MAPFCTINWVSFLICFAPNQQILSTVTVAQDKFTRITCFAQEAQCVTSVFGRNSKTKTKRNHKYQNTPFLETENIAILTISQESYFRAEGIKITKLSNFSSVLRDRFDRCLKLPETSRYIVLDIFQRSERS